MKAVILAGGRGTRLLPHTADMPKPLVPIGGKPVLELVLAYLRRQGVTDAVLSTGHLGEMIRTVFQDGSRFGLRLEYSQEDTALGTAGPLDLIRDRLTETFLVVNGDVLTDLDLARFRASHETAANAATVALCERTVTVDFGVVRLEPVDRVTAWDEKPVLTHTVSMGLYLVEPAVLRHVPRRRFLDIPDLVRALIQSGSRVGGYRHEGYWLDIGRLDDYARANREAAAGHGP
jgi:NDP-mannose synthase